MRNQDKTVFVSLFMEASQKCFGSPLVSPLSETDSKLMATKILEQTGLVIGAKSIKNYSFYVLNKIAIKSREENPSVATLDTLARYVLDAPYTDEIKRKDYESHYPYWFEFKRRFSGTRQGNAKPVFKLTRTAILIITISLSLIGFLVIKLTFHKPEQDFFNDNFSSVREDSLLSRGWTIKSKDTIWWDKRGEMIGHLALYSLRGDNWPLGNNPAKIRNLLIRKINSDCFTVEIDLTDFIPAQNWQQAGILLSEDSTLNGKMIRLSISYNDFFGGYSKPPEIIIQAISSSESGSLSKPEEIAHYSLFTIEKGRENLAKNNLAKSALKIEKRGSNFRFLYTTAEKESFAFKQVLSGNFNIRPQFVSIFSIQGWSFNESIPAYFDSFTLECLPCSK